LIGAQFIMWATLGLLFGARTQRAAAVSDATRLAHPSGRAIRLRFVPKVALGRLFHPKRRNPRTLSESSLFKCCSDGQWN